MDSEIISKTEIKIIDGKWIVNCGQDNLDLENIRGILNFEKPSGFISGDDHIQKRLIEMSKKDFVHWYVYEYKKEHDSYPDINTLRSAKTEDIKLGRIIWYSNPDEIIIRNLHLVEEMEDFPVCWNKGYIFDGCRYGLRWSYVFKGELS